MPLGLKPCCSVCKTNSSSMWKKGNQGEILCNNCTAKSSITGASGLTLSTNTQQSNGGGKQVCIHWPLSDFHVTECLELCNTELWVIAFKTAIHIIGMAYIINGVNMFLSFWKEGSPQWLEGCHCVASGFFFMIPFVSQVCVIYKMRTYITHNATVASKNCLSHLT